MLGLGLIECNCSSSAIGSQPQAGNLSLGNFQRKDGERYIKLLTKNLLQTLPALYSQEDNPDPMVVVKLFTPDAGWTWYAIEGSPVDEQGYYDTDKEKVDFVFFGLVSGLEVELGYFSLSELTSIRGKLGLPVERDRYFQPTRLSAIKTLCGYTR